MLKNKIQSLIEGRVNTSKKEALQAFGFQTVLGEMIALSDNKGLYLLEFIDSKKLVSEVEHLKKKLNKNIVYGQNPILQGLQIELNNYFSRKNFTFKTPVFLVGTEFQKQVWGALKKIPVGETRSYLDISIYIKHPKAYRAVAQANANNLLSIIIPCHRVINANGKLGGYGGGVDKKQWLINHEQGVQKI